MLERFYYLGFSACPGIGTKRLEKLIQTFGSAKNAWETASRTDLGSTIGKIFGERFDEFRKEFDIQKYAENLEKKKIQFLIPADKEYPQLLKKIPNPPYILFVKGISTALTNEKIIAIVGTRKVTPYGQEVTEMLARELVEQGFTIVSGMALGVDGIAHKETLKNNGTTIAVLGSGVEFPTPREHSNLYREILEKGGAVVSTFQPEERAGIGTFPARNAIIAGLSQAVIVTEGAQDSGALITANYAKQFGRPVFAVPGPITSSLSKGSNNLLRKGAISITSSEEILDSLGIMRLRKKKNEERETKKETKEEKIILRLLEKEPLHFDEIVRRIDRDSKMVGSMISLLELKGLIKNMADGRYSLR